MEPKTYSRFNPPPDNLRPAKSIHLLTDQKPVAVYRRYKGRTEPLYDFSDLKPGRDYLPVLRRAPKGCYHRTHLKRRFKLSDKEIAELEIAGIKYSTYRSYKLYRYTPPPKPKKENVQLELFPLCR